MAFTHIVILKFYRIVQFATLPYRATDEFFFGTWQVDKFLGFGNSYNDDIEQPNGFDIIGDKVLSVKVISLLHLKISKVSI